MPRHTGWADNARSLAAGVAIGEKTKCKYCKKVKRINQFSNKQQLDLKKMILAKGNKGNEGHQSNGWISCKSCTSGQNTEMFCVVCEETKALDQFAKTHRRTRDNAKCKACMEKITKTQPDEPFKAEDGDSSDSNRFEDDDDDDDDDITSSVNDLSIDGGERQTNFSTSTATAVQSSDGGVWVPQSRNWGGASQSSYQPSFDPSAYGSARQGVNSSSAYNSTRSSQPPIKTSKGGWAKPPKSSEPDFLEDGLSSSSDEEWNKHAEEDDSDDDGP